MNEKLTTSFLSSFDAVETVLIDKIDKLKRFRFPSKILTSIDDTAKEWTILHKKDYVIMLPGNKTAQFKHDEDFLDVHSLPNATDGSMHIRLHPRRNAEASNFQEGDVVVVTRFGNALLLTKGPANEE